MTTAARPKSIFPLDRSACTGACGEHHSACALCTAVSFRAYEVPKLVDITPTPTREKRAPRDTKDAYERAYSRGYKAGRSFGTT